MLSIGKITLSKKDNVSRIESTLKVTGEKDFQLFLDVDEQYGKYLVTDRADGLLLGVLMYALVNKHDITCENPVTSSLLFMLEKQLIPILTKYESRFHHVKIICDTVEEPIKSEGAVGTGISLGLDSSYTIAETCDANSAAMKLTHLCVFNNGTFGGWFHDNNWNYCAKKLHEKIESTAKGLSLPLIHINSNLGPFVKLRLDYYATYFILFNIISLGKLFGTYFVSSNGEDYAKAFNIRDTWHKGCSSYDLLLLSCVSLSRGTQFIVGGGSVGRGDKLIGVAKNPLLKKNLVSCLTQHYNCMECGKCKRNLLYMDAYGLLDEYAEAYDIKYYRRHRGEYIRYMCREIYNGYHGILLRDAYEIIKKREPELIEKFEKNELELRSECNKLYRQRDVFQEYTRLFRGAMLNKDFHNNIREFFASNLIHKVVIYGKERDIAFPLLRKLCEENIIDIKCVIENTDPKKEYTFLHLPESTINYPECDAIIISSVARVELIKKKISYFVNVPIISMSELLKKCS